MWFILTFWLQLTLNISTFEKEAHGIRTSTSKWHLNVQSMSPSSSFINSSNSKGEITHKYYSIFKVLGWTPHFYTKQKSNAWPCKLSNLHLVKFTIYFDALINYDPEGRFICEICKMILVLRMTDSWKTCDLAQFESLLIKHVCLFCKCKELCALFKQWLV